MEQYIKTYLEQTKIIAESVDRNEIAKMIDILNGIKAKQGRLFIIGVGGSAANASHAVNDFRKIAGIETYAPTDNVAELTARTNDEGWETTFIEWLKTSKINSNDSVLVFSVGGGSQTTSLNIVRALEHAKIVGAKVLSIVSRNGGYAKKISDACVLIPVVDENRITPHAEGWQGVIWHLVVNAVGKNTHSTEHSNAVSTGSIETGIKTRLDNLKIAIYADGADVQGMLEMAKKSYIKGFTTNPTLMQKAGVKDYLSFAKEVLAEIKTLPVSFEVFSDDFAGMKREAETLSALADNVYVKIPVTNSNGEPSYELIKQLSEAGIKLNVTAVFTLEQVRAVKDALSDKIPSIISVFAGRIADAGVDAREHMKKVKEICKEKEKAKSIKLLWASCREVYNIIEAQTSGADIITVTNDILKKAEKNLGKDLGQFSLETVNMFWEDSKTLEFTL